jgi:hypothetical protein
MVGDGRIDEAKTVMGLLWFARFGQQAVDNQPALDN